jgi:Concanavalin A-like lectin/glucanases superfamily/Secretion system C-terminal sorting domain
MKTTLLLIFLSTGISTFSQINLDSGLVAYYPFEGNANDLSINALNGTASNVIYSVGVYGAPDSSILFDGTVNSYVDCGIDNRGLTDTVAISVFFRTTFNGIGDVVSKYDAGNDRGLILEMSLGKIRFAGRDGGGIFHSTGFSLSAVNDSMWHHVLGVVRGNTWLLYIDCNLEGAQSNTTVGPDFSSNANLGIGKDVFSDAKYLDCEVDEVRIYNRELWQDEMDSLCATAVFASLEDLPKKEFHLQIYPNPANNQIAIATDLSMYNATIQIYSANGRLMMTEFPTQETPVIDINQLSSGMYILKIISEGDIVVSKFLKN